MSKRKSSVRSKAKHREQPKTKSEAPIAPPEAAEAEDGKRLFKRDAKEMATAQREISVAEFFTKNRHLLGFDNKKKALLTTVKEAVDNALDACEEAGVLPEIFVEIRPAGNERFIVVVEDNGPGIVRAQIPSIFGKLLYGSKFHRLKQSRGQQGIGISAAAMYGQLTTGSPCKVISKIGPKAKAHHFYVHLNTKKNEPEVTKDETIDWKKPHGTRVEIELEAIFQRGKRSVEEYLQQVLVANPHVSLNYKAPDLELQSWERASKAPPEEARAIKPHPYGVELGILMQMLKVTKARALKGFLMSEFSRVGPGVANEICSKAKLGTSARPGRIATQEADALYKAIQETKIQRPPTNCLSPIGEPLMLAGLKRVVADAELYAVVSRSPSVYRGNPFLIEAAIAWGGKSASAAPSEEAVAHGAVESQAEIIRFANRVPLQYQQSACAITKAIVGTNWRAYGVTQPRGALPIGPLVVAVHIASAWVPFTSESKEAIASYPEIAKDMKLALQECGRRLGAHIRKRVRIEDAEKKKSYIKTYIPQLSIALQLILGLSDKEVKRTTADLTDVLERSRTIE